MIILGYLFTVINYIFYCASRFLADKKYILLMDLIAKIFTVLGLYCLGSLSGAITFIITFFMLIFANIKERHQQKWLFLFILLQLLYFATLVYQYDGLPSILIFITSSVNMLCVWWFNPQNMRLVGGLNSVLFLLYQISIKNWAGLIEILVILSNLISYLKYRPKKKNLIPLYKK